jgi:hypothetical protein
LSTRKYRENIGNLSGCSQVLKFWKKQVLYAIWEGEQLRNWGIGGLMDKINNLKKIEFLQFLNS